MHRAWKTILFLAWMLAFTVPCQAFFGSGSLDSKLRSMSRELVQQGNLNGVFVLISPHNFYDARTHLSLPFARLLREKMITEMKGAGARILVDGADDEFFMVLQGSWIDDGDDLSLTFKVMHLTKDGPEVKASATDKVSKNKIDASLLTPDRDSWARFMVRTLEEKTDNWLKRTVYLPPFKGKDCLEEFGTYLSGWLSPALVESTIMVPLDQTRELFEAPIETLRTRGTRGISRIKVNSPDQPSFTAELINAETELKGHYFLHEKKLEIRLKLTDRQGKQLSAATAEIPADVFPAHLLQARPEPKFIPNDIPNDGSASLSLNGLKVELTTTKGEARPYYKQGEEIRFLLRLNRPAWVYLFDLNPAGEATLLYPVDENGHLARNAGFLNSPEKPLILPEDGYSYELIADEPFGTDQVLAIAAESPLEFPKDLSGDWSKAEYLQKNLRKQGLKGLNGYSEVSSFLTTGN